MKSYAYLIGILFVVTACCEDAYFTDKEFSSLVPDIKYLDTMIFISENKVLKDTLLLNKISRDSIPCNPLETTKYNREIVTFTWQSISPDTNYKRTAFFQVFKRKNTDQLEPTLSLYNVYGKFKADTINMETLYIFNKKRSPYFNKKINSFKWSSTYGFIEYEDDNGVIWKRKF